MAPQTADNPSRLAVLPKNVGIDKRRGNKLPPSNKEMSYSQNKI